MTSASKAQPASPRVRATSPAAPELGVAERAAKVSELRDHGVSVAEACRRVGLSTSTYYRYRSKEADRAASTPPTELAGDDLEGAPPVAVMALISASPWTAPMRSAPLAPGAYWRTAFSTELSDSAIFRHLFGEAFRSSAPGARRPWRLAPKWYNRLGQLGLPWLAMGLNQALTAASTLTLKLR